MITVVGAGRGPLVSSCLAAAATLGVRAHVYAVEKNRNAVITLRNRCASAFDFFGPTKSLIYLLTHLLTYLLTYSVYLCWC